MLGKGILNKLKLFIKFNMRLRNCLKLRLIIGLIWLFLPSFPSLGLRILHLSPVGLELQGLGIKNPKLKVVSRLESTSDFKAF